MRVINKCSAVAATQYFTSDSCVGVAVFNLVSYPDPLPAAISFPARIKWRSEVGLGTRLFLTQITCLRTYVAVVHTLLSVIGLYGMAILIRAESNLLGMTVFILWLLYQDSIPVQICMPSIGVTQSSASV